MWENIKEGWICQVGYLALYRRWRPENLDDIVGQQHVTQTLRNALLMGKVSHAYLFCGPRGTGKTSTAKVLSRAVNCTAPVESRPCNSCNICLEIKSGVCMDVQEIDAASNRGIDEMRELRENVKYFPSLGSKRVYIIDEVHMLTNEAFNALLKTLEDPPDHVVFILATTEPHKVPLTVLSRCQRFDFRPIPDDVVIKRLNQVAADSGFGVDQAALKLITRAAAGSMRDALSLLDQSLLLSHQGHQVAVETVQGILGTVQEDILTALATGMARQDMVAVLNLIDTVISDGKDLFLLTSELTAFLRSVLLMQLTPETDQADTTGCRGLFSNRQLIKLVDALVAAEQTMRYSTHPRVALEMALIKVADVMSDTGEAEHSGIDTAVYQKLRQRVEHLEQQVRQMQQVPVPQPTSPTQPAAPVGSGRQSLASADGQPGGADANGRQGQGPMAAVLPRPQGADVVNGPDQDMAPASRPGTGTGQLKEGVGDDAGYDVNQDTDADLLDALDALAGQECPREISQGQLSGLEVASEPKPQAPRPKHAPPVVKSKTIAPPPPSALKDEAEAQQQAQQHCSVEQIKGWWPDILAQIRKSSQRVYHCLKTGQVWPLEVKGRQLVLGVTEDEFIIRGAIDDEASKKLLAQALACFVPQKWQIRCTYHPAPPKNWGEQPQTQLGFQQTMSMFQGQAVSLEDEQNQNEEEI